MFIYCSTLHCDRILEHTEQKSDLNITGILCTSFTIETHTHNNIENFTEHCQMSFLWLLMSAWDLGSVSRVIFIPQNINCLQNNKNKTYIQFFLCVSHEYFNRITCVKCFEDHPEHILYYFFYAKLFWSFFCFCFFGCWL